jgi:tetratricopeptide (TPR) repeat protein
MRQDSASKTWILWLAGCLLLTFICLYPSVENGWTNWDDPLYVLENPLVHSLEADNLAAIFSTKQVAANYHPITVLSLALDFSLHGTAAGGFHATSLLLHLINVALAFALMWMLTGRADLSALCAALFGVHPMNVEAVAWISARKDLLLGLFFLLGLMAYLRYVRKQEKKALFFALTLVAFVLALLSKAVAVTFPIVLFAVDYLEGRRFRKTLVLEKIPFFLLSLACGLLALSIQKETANLPSLGEIPFYKTVFYPFYGLILYLLKAIVPHPLSSVHLYPEAAAGGLPWYVYASIVAVMALAFCLVRYGRQNRRLLFGVSLFVLPLLPTLQFLPIGFAIIAERYVYIPYLGLFYLLTCALQHLTNRVTGFRSLLAIGVVGASVLVFGYLAHERSQVWKDSYTLWTHVIENYPDKVFGYYQRGGYFTSARRPDLALPDYQQTVRVNPGFADGFNNIGLAYFQLKDFNRALASCTQAIDLDGSSFTAYVNRAVIYMNLQMHDSALTDLNTAISLNSEALLGYVNRGLIYEKTGQYAKSMQDYSRAIELAPENPSYYNHRGAAKATLGDLEGADADFLQALALDPNLGHSYYLRSQVLRVQKKYDEALQSARKAEQLKYPLERGYLEALIDLQGSQLR